MDVSGRLLNAFSTSIARFCGQGVGGDVDWGMIVRRVCGLAFVHYNAADSKSIFRAAPIEMVTMVTAVLP
jgi:hypothetical protein